MSNEVQSQEFPTIEAETLSGKKILFPDITTGKYALILVAFKRQTQGEVDSWLDPFIEEFGDRESVTFYEIPMISKNWKWMSGWIDAGMRSGVPKNKHDHVATYYGPLTEYFDYFGVDDSGKVYVFLLDPEGNIIWKTSGRANENTFNELRALMREKTGN